MNAALTSHAQHVVNDLIQERNVTHVEENHYLVEDIHGELAIARWVLRVTILRDDGVYVGRRYLRNIGRDDDENDPNGDPYEFEVEDEEFAHIPPAPPAQQADQQMGGSIASLRTLCNQRGMSCRDANGKLLPKSKLVKLLRS